MSDEEQRRNYAMAFRKPLSIIVPYLLNAYANLHWAWAIALGVAMYVVTEFLYHKLFLSKLVSSSNVEIEKGKGFLENLASLETPKVIISIIVGIALTITTYINANQRGYTGFTLYFNYIFCLFILAISVYLLVQLIIRFTKKH